MDQFVTFSGRDQFLVAADVRTGEFFDVDLNIEVVTGWQPAELMGKSAREFMHPDDLEIARQGAETLVAVGKSRIECRIRHADGEHVRYQVLSTLGADGTSAYHWFRGAAQLVAEFADFELYHKLVEVAADIFIVTDEFGTVEAINPAGAEIHGMTQSEMIGCHVLDFTPPEAAEVFETIVERAIARERVIDFRIPAYDHAGQVIHMDGQTTFDPDTRRFYTVERNVTERVERELELAIGHRFFELAGSQLAMIDADDRIMRANPAFLDCFDVDDDASGRPLLEVLGVGPEGALALAIDRARATGETATLNAMVLTPAGLRTLSCTLTATSDGTVFYNARDATDELRMADELRDRATRDQLTRLATREVFHETLAACLATDEQVGVVMADLDDFKRVNDSLGHETGDELLRQVGGRVIGAVRDDDLVARFGGDEFVIVLRNLRSSGDATLVAEKIRAAIAHPYQLGGREIHTGASLGVTIGDGRTHDASRFLREADAAAYEAKRAGRNTVRFFSAGLEAAIAREQVVEAELRAALQERRFDIDVQGIFTTDGRLRGVEALARLITIDGERKAPGHFLDVAQRLGLLRRIGEAIVERSFETLSGWLVDHPGLVVSLNADPSELASPGWADVVEAAMNRHGIDPSQLVIEATERGVLDVDGPAGHALRQLRTAGVTIAMDDFGTGASSLGHIRDGLVSAVKIDRSFTQRLSTDPIAKSITVAVLTLANDLDMPVVAEGVEHLDLLPLLADLGCPLVQGFGLHRPEPVEQFVADTSRRIGGELAAALR